MMYRTFRVILIGLFACYAFQAGAIVNVESMRVGSETPGLSGTLDLAVSGKRGNTEQDVYGAAGRLQYNWEMITDFVVASYDYGKVNHLVNTNKSFLHARHVVQYQPHRAWEAFAQLEKNEFLRLSFRGLLGAGVRYTLVEVPEQRGLYLGTGAFWSRETLEPRPGLTDQGTEELMRGSFYVVYKEKLNSQLHFVTTTYYQPRLNGMSDYRVLEQAAMTIKMTEKLDLKLSLDIAHDSRPPQSIQQTDTSYSTSFSFKF